MKSRIARLFAIALCLVAPIGFAAHAHADTSATVSVSGEVVDTSMSFTLSTGTFTFGTIDTTGDAYDEATSPAQPFAVTGGLNFGIPDGTAWFARTPITLTVTTPVAARIAACMTAHTNVLDGEQYTRLNLTGAIPPQGSSDIWTYLSGRAVPTCASGGSTGVEYEPGADQQSDLYPTYLVRPNDTPNSFSATVQFSLSPFSG